MKKIDPSDLLGQGYAEASEWDHGFGKAYGWPSVILAVAFFAGLLVALQGRVNLGGLIMLVSFVVILVLWCLFRHSNPVSPITGKRLTQYLSTSPTPRNAYASDRTPIIEMVYVDHESKKFFRHVFVENDPIGS